MSDHFFATRVQNQQNNFPEKWAKLPNIGHSPEPRNDRAVVPYTGRDGGSLYSDTGGGGGGGSMGADPATMERVRELEDRLMATEKSNRALLEEVVRLQSDWKGITRRQEELLTGERKSRMQIENSLRASNDLIAQLASRLKRNEERAMEEHSTVAALLSHTKSIEQSMSNQQQDHMSKKEVQQARIQDLQGEMNEVMRMKDNMERVSFALVDEVRKLKTKLDTQSSEIVSTTNDLKSRTRRLEEESRAGFEVMRRNNENQQTVELSTTQLRTQIESRLSELRDVVVELRGRQEQANQDHHRLEQQMQVRLGEVSSSVQEQNRKREEALHTLETSQREKDHSAELEKTKLQSKIGDIAEEVSKKILMKEIKLREELQQRYASLEAIMREESETRRQFERDVKREMADQMELVKSMQGSELAQAEDLIKGEKKRQNEKLQKLLEAQDILDTQRQEQDKVLTAEIKLRKRDVKDNSDKIKSLQEKLSVATSTLQQALGGLSMQMNSAAEKLRREMKDIVADMADSRAYTDLDTRVTALSQKYNQMEDLFDAKLKDAAALQTQNMREKIESIALWQEVTQQTLKEIQNQVQAASEEVYLVDERQKLMKAEIKQRVFAESEARTRDIEALKGKLNTIDETMKNKDEESGKKLEEDDMENIKSSIRKLAESITTVKSVLSMKMQSESKLRFEEMKALQNDIIILRMTVQPFLKNKPQPRLFIKEEEDLSRERAENSALPINKWSMYTAFRWCVIKQRWLFLKWKREFGARNGPALMWNLPNSSKNEDKSDNAEPDGKENLKPEKEDPDVTDKPDNNDGNTRGGGEQTGDGRSDANV